MKDGTNLQGDGEVSGLTREALREKYAAMRDSGANRAELSRQACADLFANGEMPTAKLVRELTSIGSLTDISRDVHTFWQDVRRSSQKRIKADLPESVLDLAGKLATEVFDHAVLQADARLKEARAECASRVDQARSDLDVERAAREAAEEVNSALGEELRAARQDLAALRERHAALDAELHASMEAKAALQTQIDRHFARIQELESAIAEQQRAAEQATLDFADRLRAADEEAQARIRPLLVELDAFRTHEREWKQQRAEHERRQFESLEIIARTTGERNALQTTNDQLMQQIGALSRSLATAEHAAKSAGLTAPAKAAIERAFLATADRSLLFALERTYLPDLAPHACPSCRQHTLSFEQTGDEYSLHCAECEWESEQAATPIEALALCARTGKER